MKYFFLLTLSIVLSNNCFGQTNLPIVKSTSKTVKIIENKEHITDWNLDSSLKFDTYITGKNAGNRNVKMLTDIDSIEVNLKPNQEFDFVVLLNKTDSCFTKFKSLETKNFSKINPPQTTIIPIVLSKDNNIETNAILNKKDSMKLLFDSGATGFYLKKTAITKFLNPENKPLTMKDISDNHFQLGNLEWDHEQIYPLETTGDCCEGMYGWDSFDGKIVTIDYDKNEMTVSTKKTKIELEYERFEMELMKEHFCIQLELEIDHKRYKSRFLFDTGFQKTLMLDHDLMNNLNVPIADLPLLKKSVMYNSRKEEIPVNIYSTPKLIFGKYILENVPVQLNSTTKPAGYLTNLVGNEVLKRFNVILDFQENVVYLKPNHLYYADYIDLKKS